MNTGRALYNLQKVNIFTKRRFDFLIEIFMTFQLFYNSVPGFSQDVRHGEEMNFIITRSYGGLNTTDLTKYPKVDQTVQQRMITFFTNFAKYR